MICYVQFYTKLLSGKVDEAVGSDAVHPLDARLSLDNMINEAYEQAHRLRKVKKYTGFKIMKTNTGYYSKSFPISPYYPI